MHLKISYAEWGPFCLGPIVLMAYSLQHEVKETEFTKSPWRHGHIVTSYYDSDIYRSDFFHIKISRSVCRHLGLFSVQLSVHTMNHHPTLLLWNPIYGYVDKGCMAVSILFVTRGWAFDHPVTCDSMIILDIVSAPKLTSYLNHTWASSRCHGWL